MLRDRTVAVDDDPLVMLTSHVSKDPPAFADVAPGVEIPPGIEAVINRGLAKISAERISTAFACVWARNFASSSPYSGWV